MKKICYDIFCEEEMISMKLIAVRNTIEVDGNLNRDDYNYYSKELDKLKDLTTLTFQMSDYDGNKTKYISLNKESLVAMLDLLIRKGIQ